ncbi:MAG TPA: hypothetical protein VH396_12400 [Chitinophagaceae bacterium]|jgi:hypothetical protein
MSKILLACLIIIIATECKNKHSSLSGEEHVNMKEFIEAFPKITFPYRVADTNTAKKSDTTIISYAVFSEFIPDTVLTNALGASAGKMIINPVGKIEKEDELYLLANFTLNKKTTLQAFLFDKKNKYLSHLELIKQGNKDNYVHSVSITSEPTFIIGREKTNQQNELKYTRIGYAYNSAAHNFIAVINDSNEDLKSLSQIINPIDTFAAKNKFSGNYTKDKRNFITVRDGSNTNKYLFFVHFEKDNNCNGELKGEMTMRDATHAYYQQSGDPCVIDFTFTAKNITVKERGNCGNHRGIKCFFDDTYKKKKESKTPVSKGK